MKLISVILSFRNEAKTIPEMTDRLEKALGALAEDYEVIYVNDDSTDGSLALLTDRHARNPRIKAINLSRRFGTEPAMFAGMALARGDAVVTIDADLQDPPELIPELVRLWREGADVVYTVRQARKGEPWLKLFLTGLAYHTIRQLADIHIPLDAGDFRLLSRRVVDQLLRLEEPNTYLRGLVQWVGYRRVPFFYVREARAAGQTHFGPLSRNSIATFFYGVTGFSAMPVYAVALGGLIATFAATLALAVLAVVDTAAGPVGAPAWLAAALLWFWGSLLTAIGIVGLYVVRIFRTTLARPRYLIDTTLGIDPPSSGSSPPS
jgi:dolichol-phosphate mannosyltransferase